MEVKTLHVRKLALAILSVGIIVTGVTQECLAATCDSIIGHALGTDQNAPITTSVSTYLCGGPSLTLDPPYSAFLSAAWRTANCSPATSTLKEVDARIIGIAAVSSTDISSFNSWHICQEDNNANIDWNISHTASSTTITLFSIDPSSPATVTGIYALNATCPSTVVGASVPAAGLPITCSNVGTGPVTFVLETDSGILARSYDDPAESVVAGCPDEGIPGTNFLGKPSLVHSPAFVTCVDALMKVPDQTSCGAPPPPGSSIGVLQAYLACSRHILCLQDIVIGKTQLEDYRLACKSIGGGSPECAQFAFGSGQSRLNGNVSQCDQPRGGPFIAERSIPSRSGVCAKTFVRASKPSTTQYRSREV